MAKSLVLGNGNLVIGLDAYGQVRDLYYPHVGLDHHVGRDLLHKIGVFADGRLSWIDSGEWRISISYEAETLVSSIHAEHDALGLALRFSDMVYNERDIFMRSIQVENRREHERTIRLFLNQQFRISENVRGDTAYFRADLHSILHYKGRRVFLISGQVDGRFFDEYSVGLLGIEGREGTWRDAEDGVLTKNPIEHGSVDSTVGFTLTLAAKATRTVEYWLAAGRAFNDVTRLHREILSRGPGALQETTRDYWSAWLNKREFTFHGLSDEVVRLFKTSLLMLRMHADNGGGILASIDSDILQQGRDTYNYVWPRDGAYIALALCKAGYFDVAERFFEFCRDTITDEGYLLHKYLSDRSFGSSWHPWVDLAGRAQLPIQEDETASVLVTLWEYYEYTKNLEFVEVMYNPLIKRAADFLVRYRDRASGLPRPSYDLWEERRGVFCYTTASVCGALVAAARFAELLGKSVAANRYRSAADLMRQALLSRFPHDGGLFMKSIQPKEDGTVEADQTPDISAPYGVFRFGVLEAHDPQLSDAFKKTIEHLTPATPVGGIARYAGDKYFTVDQNLPGNPWCFASLWKAEYDIARAKNEADLQGAKDALEWIVRHASPSGMIPEQLNPYTGAHVSVSPLAWSHAGFVLAVVAYLEKLEALGICDACYPLNG